MDLFDVLEANRRVAAEEWLMNITIQGLQYMKEEDSRKLLDSLRRQAGYVSNSRPKFDEAGFEALKMKLKMGW